MTALRRAGAEDAPAIAGLTRKAYAKWVDLLGREPLPMQVDYAEALARHRFDVMERDGRLVGLIETVADGDFLLVVNVAVDPAWQGQGLGAELMALAERLAGKANLRGLRLYTNSRFAANIRFYERLGFEKEREAPLNGGVALYMTKRLARGLAPTARDALDLRAHEALDHRRQVLVEPNLQHRLQHLARQVLGDLHAMRGKALRQRLERSGDRVFRILGQQRLVFLGQGRRLGLGGLQFRVARPHHGRRGRRRLRARTAMVQAQRSHARARRWNRRSAALVSAARARGRRR